MAQAVTVSPSFRQASGLRSFFLHSMKATRCFEQRTARCFDMLISTAEVGGGVSPSDAIINYRPPLKTSAKEPQQLSTHHAAFSNAGCSDLDIYLNHSLATVKRSCLLGVGCEHLEARPASP